MKELLLPHLICPTCLPREEALQPKIAREQSGDIVQGHLSCPRCRHAYPIKNGIADLRPAGSVTTGATQRRYEEPLMTGRYLWSQYGDLLGEQTREGALRTGWEELCTTGTGVACETGCAVGRLTFELASSYSLSVGCDLSTEFIATARQLAHNRRIAFNLPLEGKLTERFELQLPEQWRCDRVEFIVADALRLPFATDCFQQVCSLNLLDRVNYPLAHLYELNRVASDSDSSLLIADPFSWEHGPAPEERWLGGSAHGPYPGRGMDNLRALLEGKDRVLQPAWRIEQSGSLAWRLRSHRNHYEVITSEYLVARR